MTMLGMVPLNEDDNEQAWRAQWLEFFQVFMRREVERLAQSYPDEQSLRISWFHIERFIPREIPEGEERPLPNIIADAILRRPRAALAAAQLALKEWVTPRGGNGPFALHEGVRTFIPFVRVYDLPEHHRISIRGLRARHMHKLIEIEGLVKRVGEALPRIAFPVWQCQTCSASFPGRPQKEWDDEYKKPTECNENEGGCGRDGHFELDEDRTVWSDVQFLQLQEPPEQLDPALQPLGIDVFAEADLVDEARPGDRVVITGFIAPKVLRKQGKEQRHHEKRFMVVSITKRDERYEEIEITDEDEARIRAAAEARDEHGELLIYRRIVSSIGTTIVGNQYEHIKLAGLFAIFGGTQKLLPDGGSIRNDIHILLVGDPGLAKTRLLRSLAAFAPRGIYTSGQQATAAGLTAAVVHDQFTGGFALEVGALALADRGICVVDEIEKMDKGHLANLTSVLEQQKINIAKAGIIAEINARTTVLAAANPKGGKFDDKTHVFDQVELPPYILSRFFIFIMKDKPEKKQDLETSKAVLFQHRAINRVGDERRHEVEPYYTREFLRKYVAFAKREYAPTLDDEAINYLSEYYSHIRNLTTEDGQGSGMTFRQLEDLERLAEASAKIRLSNVATKEDAVRATEIFQEYIKAVAMNDGGTEINFNVVNSGRTINSQQERESTLRRIVHNLMEASQDGCFDMADLFEQAEQQQITRRQVESHTRYWRDHAMLLEPRVERFRYQSRSR